MLAVLLCLALAACAPPRPPAASGSTVSGADAPPLDDLARRVHDETNAARDRAERGRLRWSKPLAQVARLHSEDMAARRFFGHDSPDGGTPQTRAAARGVKCRRTVGAGKSRVGVLENLYRTTRYARIRTWQADGMTTQEAEWYTADLLASAAVEGWLDSPGHRANLLDRFAEAEGIGVAVGRNHAVFVTQVLC